VERPQFTLLSHFEAVKLQVSSLIFLWFTFLFFKRGTIMCLKASCEHSEDGDQREEAESEPPKVKSWRDTGEHLAGKTPRRGKTLTPPHLQPAHSISTSC
jgi:hypothetical protein